MSIPHALGPGPTGLPTTFSSRACTPVHCVLLALHVTSASLEDVTPAASMAPTLPQIHQPFPKFTNPSPNSPTLPQIHQPFPKFTNPFPNSPTLSQIHGPSQLVLSAGSVGGDPLGGSLEQKRCGESGTTPGQTPHWQPEHIGSWCHLRPHLQQDPRLFRILELAIL
jgi:hypothetical protein